MNITGTNNPRVIIINNDVSFCFFDDPSHVQKREPIECFAFGELTKRLGATTIN